MDFGFESFSRQDANPAKLDFFWLTPADHLK
jgi:hypothetical protein